MSIIIYSKIQMTKRNIYYSIFILNTLKFPLSLSLSDLSLILYIYIYKCVELRVCANPYTVSLRIRQQIFEGCWTQTRL